MVVKTAAVGFQQTVLADAPKQYNCKQELVVSETIDLLASREGPIDGGIRFHNSVQTARACATAPSIEKTAGELSEPCLS